MEYLTTLMPFGLGILSFFIKAAIIVVAILLIISAAIKEKSQDKITVKDLNKRFKNYRRILLGSLLDKKKLKKEFKAEDKADKKNDNGKDRTFVVHFKGDMRASAVEELREIITAILSVATPKDEVVVTVESPGGMVHGYGLAASQLQRIKDAGVPFTVCVDKVAASGGYMMACLADKIIAAPFSIVGSVGVVAGVPNFNRLLKKNDVDYYQITSGKFKRTVSLLGEVTDDGLKKFKEEIEETHVLFKEHIKKFRPQVDVEKIATGEHWYGQVALSLNLVDELGTSDDYLYKHAQTRTVKEVSFHTKKSLKEKLADGMAHIFSSSYDSVNDKFSSRELH